MFQIGKGHASRPPRTFARTGDRNGDGKAVNGLCPWILCRKRARRPHYRLAKPHEELAHARLCPARREATCESKQVASKLNLKFFTVVTVFSFGLYHFCQLLQHETSKIYCYQFHLKNETKYWNNIWKIIFLANFQYGEK